MLLRTSALARAIVTLPERPTAWARTTRGIAGAAFQKDKSELISEAVSASAAAADPGSAFARSAFARVGGSVQTKPPTPYGAVLPARDVFVRTARREDIPQIEACNLKTLPENYPNAFYHNHLLQWPYLALVAERRPLDSEGREIADAEKKVVGYVLGRVETTNVGPSLYDSSSMQMYGRISRFTALKTGHVSSLAVLDEYRRHGIGRELMDILHVQMRHRYGVDCSTLHVRCSNRGAQKLYLDALGYKIVDTVQRYYQDGADAYFMKLDFDTQSEPLELRGAGSLFKEKEMGLLKEDTLGYFTFLRNGNGATAASAMA